MPDGGAVTCGIDIGQRRLHIFVCDNGSVFQHVGCSTRKEFCGGAHADRQHRQIRRIPALVGCDIVVSDLLHPLATPYADAASDESVLREPRKLGVKDREYTVLCLNDGKLDFEPPEGFGQLQSDIAAADDDGPFCPFCRLFDALSILKGLEDIGFLSPRQRRPD
ncbi:hypothetical protein SDC9_95347 [bioreactor metagenome]|uniref:Uncharacterized protein n=1 Tax=bioreactor metagenome TaxID=1076179 RepID=A0A645A8L7_9ZZZZ